MNITLRDVLTQLDSILFWTYVDRPEELLIEGLSTSPQTIKKYFLYISSRSENERGHDLVGAAVRNGAVATIADRAIEANVPVIYCRDSELALKQLFPLFS